MITTPEQMRESAARLIEATAYTSNGDTRSLEPVSAGLVGMDMHHATIAAAIRAIPIAPQPVAVAVKPLVWEDPCNGNGWLHVARSVFGDYYISIDGGRHSAWLEAHLRPHENNIGDDVGSVWEAKALANADYDARTRALVQPADPLSDPRVVALVEAAKAFMHDVDDLIANSEGVSGLHMNGDVADWESLLPGGMFGAWLVSIDEFRAALRSIGGEA